MAALAHRLGPSARGSRIGAPHLGAAKHRRAGHGPASEAGWERYKPADPADHRAAQVAVAGAQKEETHPSPPSIHTRPPDQPKTRGW
jgi:hypothetical protein